MSLSVRRVVLYVLSPNLWPKRVNLKIDGQVGDLGVKTEELALEQPAEFFKGHIGQVVWIFLLSGTWGRFYLNYYLRRRRWWEKLLIVCGATMLLVIGFLVAVDLGLRLPWTDFDEEIREGIQRISWLPSTHHAVRFSRIRPFYYSNVRYVIPARSYDVPKMGKDPMLGSVIQKSAEVVVEPGVTFKMEPGASFLVFGKFLAQGNEDKKIVFERANPDQAWGNLTFWEPESSVSKLEYCEIRGGGGRGCKGSTDGVFVRDESGAHVGGGLLLYRSSATVRQSLIENCDAYHGGGMYIRGEPKDEKSAGPKTGSATGSEAVGLPGARFTNVTVRGCTASGSKDSGGGGVLVKSTYPEFTACQFVGNHAVGKYACGGGLYVGVDARVRLLDCTWRENNSEAEGGGIYAYKPRDTGDENTGGLIVRGGEIVSNRANGTGGGVSGVNARATLIGVIFQNNHVQARSDAGPDAQSSGGGVFLKYENSFRSSAFNRVEGCKFLFNVAEAPTVPPEALADRFCGGGMALFTTGRIHLSLSGLTFNSNAAPFGRQLALPVPRYFDGWNGNWAGSSLIPGPEIDPSAVYRFPKAGPAWASQSLVIDGSRQLPPDCYNERPSMSVVNAVVIHFISAAAVPHAAAYDLETIFKIFKGQVSAAQSIKTSAHYLIDRDGTVYLLVDESKRAWHAGLSKMPGTGEEDVNDFSVGIEMVRTAADPPTDQQYYSLAKLLVEIKRRHPQLTRERIVGHDMVRSLWKAAHPGRPTPDKQDPGPLFHWSRLMTLLDEAGFSGG